jgi:preprotein translocase subunit SecY
MSAGLARRIAFTLGALLVYRIGAYIPLPGTNAVAWSKASGLHSHGIFGLMDMPAAGPARHFALFALGLVPFITAAILMQFTSIGWSRLRHLSAAGDRGREKIVAYTLYLTILLAAFQAYGVAHGLEGLDGLVAQPGAMFKVTTILTLTAGTLLLVWLSNQITARGVGNGLVLVFAVNLVVELPATAALAWEQLRQGYLSADRFVVGVGLAVVVTVIIVVVEGARRVIAVEFPEQTIGGKTLARRSTDLMLKVNSAGMIPTVFASWVISLVIVGFIIGAGPDNHFALQLGHGHPLFMAVFSTLVVLLTLFYTGFLIDPDKAGETLKKLGGVVRGVAPGEATADFLDDVLSRVTIIGAVYLALVFIVPEILIVYLGVPFWLGGAGFLVMICAVMDLAAQFKQEAELKVGGIRT